MAEETKASDQNQQKQSDFGTGELSTILVSVGTLIDSTIEPVSKVVMSVGTLIDSTIDPVSRVVASVLDSLAVVAKQVLESVSSTLGGKK